MSNQIQPFNQNQYVETLRAKLRDAIANVIPDEQLEAMAKAEMKAFFEDDTVPAQFGNPARTIPSLFKKAVHGLLEDDVKARVKAFLNTPEWKEKWDEEPLASEAVKKLLVEHSGEIMSAWLANEFQSVLFALKNR